MSQQDPTPPWLASQRLAIGRCIRDARMRANLTQEGLAGRCGWERRAIFRIEAGITDPPISRLLHIARALDMPLAELVRDV